MSILYIFGDKKQVFVALKFLRQLPHSGAKKLRPESIHSKLDSGCKTGCRNEALEGMTSEGGGLQTAFTYILSMYLYSFDRFFGLDKVCLLGDMGKKKIKPGDLLVFGNQYFLAIGDNLVFSEQYQHLETVKAELVYKEFMTQPTLKLFHWMVETYYTTYKSVARLFFSNNIEKLLEREGKLKTGKDKKFEIGNSKFEIGKEGQTLIVFPDLWTMMNQRGNDETTKGQNVITLLASDTEKQKDVHRWEVKKGMKSVIVCTYAEIFQDFHDLKKIIFVDPHKRYYANQQDPRYKVGDVIEEMKKLYGAEVEIMGV